MHYTTPHHTTLHSITLHYTTLPYITLHYTALTTPQQMQLRKHYTNYTTPQLQLHYITTTAALHHTTGEVTDQLTAATIATTPSTQLQPPFGPSVDSLCHPWFTTTNLSYRFPIFETSATALCGTTGTIYKYQIISYNIVLCWIVLYNLILLLYCCFNSNRITLFCRTLEYHNCSSHKIVGVEMFQNCSIHIYIYKYILYTVEIS